MSNPHGYATYINAPYYSLGPGTLLFFEGGGRKMQTTPYKHHLRLASTFMALDGCVMAQWNEGDVVTCRIVCTDSDADDMETSSD